MVSKSNRMTQEACTKPIQKKRRNSRRAREENPGEPVFAQSVVKCGRQCVLLSSTWFSPHKGRTTNVARAGLRAVPPRCACACAEPQCPRPAFFSPAHATPSLEPVLTLGPVPGRPVPPSRGARRSHEAQSPACPVITYALLCYQRRVALARRCAAAADLGRGQGRGQIRGGGWGRAGSEVTWVNTLHVELSLRQKGGAAGSEEGGR